MRLPRRTWLAWMVAAPACAAAAAGRTAGTADAAFAELAARYFADKMDLDPLAASAMLTDARYQGRLAITIAPDEIARASALNRRTLRELAALPAARLSPPVRLSHRLLGDEARLALAGDRFPGHLMPIDQYGGVPLILANLASGDQAQPLKTPADHEHYLARLQRMPDFNAQAIANMREGLRRGVTLPRPLVDSALPALKALIAAEIDGSPFAQALKAIPATAPEDDRRRIETAYRALYAQQLRPSLQALVDFMAGPYRDGCRSSAGLGALPDGAAWYAHLVRAHTTTTMTPHAIHRLGLAEVARIRREMARVQERLAPGRSFDDVGAFLRWHANEPRFRPYRTWDEVVDAYRALKQRVVPQLGRYFGRAPRLALELRPVPELLRNTTTDYYTPPAADGSRPGVFYVGSTEPERFVDAWMSSLLLHEGQPGHHYQVALQYELELPDFRRYGWSTAFGEGWALYAETLGHELGLYTDPNQYLGHLKLELLRAVRLVTDTGLHAMGWSRERTMRYMMDTEGSSENDARIATERYMAVPAQALAYKIGSLKIQALRRRAEARLGARFSLADFHDLVLSQGTVPLQVLEEMVDAHIAGRR